MSCTSGNRRSSSVSGAARPSTDNVMDASMSSALYAEDMLASITLSVDGRAAPLTLLDRRFPDVHDMSLGVGTIRLRAVATLWPTAAGRPQLFCVNTHRP